MTPSGGSNIIERARHYFGRENADAIKVSRYVVLLVDQDGMWRYAESGRASVVHGECGHPIGAEHLAAVGEACSQWARA